MTLIEEIKNIKNGMITRATEEEIKITKGTIQKSMKTRRENMMTRKGLGVLQEGKDPVEKIETIKEETTIEETTALIEGNMPLKEGAGGNIDLIEEGREARETILLI